MLHMTDECAGEEDSYDGEPESEKYDETRDIVAIEIPFREVDARHIEEKRRE